MRSVKKENNIKTIYDVYEKLSGVFDIFNKNGEEINDLDYPDDTEVEDIVLMDTEYYQVILSTNSSIEIEERKNVAK